MGATQTVKSPRREGARPHRWFARARAEAVHVSLVAAACSSMRGCPRRRSNRPRSRGIPRILRVSAIRSGNKGSEGQADEGHRRRDSRRDPPRQEADGAGGQGRTLRRSAESGARRKSKMAATRTACTIATCDAKGAQGSSRGDQRLNEPRRNRSRPHAHASPSSARGQRHAVPQALDEPSRQAALPRWLEASIVIRNNARPRDRPARSDFRRPQP